MNHLHEVAHEDDAGARRRLVLRADAEAVALRVDVGELRGERHSTAQRGGAGGHVSNHNHSEAHNHPNGRQDGEG